MELQHFEALYPPTTREEEVKKILELVKKGSSVQVAGIPGVGRSNLLGLFPYNKKVRLHHLGENEKWFHFVYMDFSEVKNRRLLDVIKFMLISLAYSLNERDMKNEHDTINSLIKEAIVFQDELILFQALKRSVDFLAIEKEMTLVFIFDRFDQYTLHVQEDFFSNLKILRNRAKYRFSALFSVSRPLEDNLELQILSPFYEFVAGNTIYLPITNKVSLEFRIEYLEKASGRKNGKVIPEILTLTGGHGKLTLMAYESVLSESSPPDDISSFLLTKERVRGALYEIWQNLTPEEQATIHNNRIESCSEDDYIIKSGLITSQKVLAIPLLASFATLLPEQKPRIEYFPERGEIHINNESIEEKLSASEFRLLKYLLENKDRVCEKDEIIKAVWRDDKTQEGVTDQALDQIVYRLRKKIEPDPNSPIFIQTIKGRGYRFQE